MDNFGAFMWRWRKPLLAGGLLLALGGFVGWNLAHVRIDPRLEAMRKKGYPATLAQLNAWYPEILPSENAARVYLEAFKSPLFKISSPGGRANGDVELLPPRGEKLSAEDQVRLEAFFATNQPALALLHSVGPGRRSRYPIDLTQGFNTLLPHIAQVRRGVLVLSAEALLRSAEGKDDEAVESLQAAGRLADSLTLEPLIISQLVRMASWGLLFKRVERIVNAGPLSDEPLAVLQKLATDAEHPDSLERAWIGEQAIGVAFFTERGAQSQVFGSGLGGPLGSSRSGARAMITAMQVTGIFGRDRSVYMQIVSNAVAAAQLPFPARVERGRWTEKMSTNLVTRFCIFSRMMVPGVTSTFLADADHATRVRVAATALAVERFRLAHTNALPNSLNELVPAFLSAVPPDPYDGKPLRFKQLNPGFVIYGLGRDGKDDDGAEGKPNSAKPPPDISFTVGR